MEEKRRGKKRMCLRDGYGRGADGGRDCEDSQGDRERANESYGDKVCVGEG